MAYFNGKEGVWRTIGGRKVFIVNGQSLNDAMKQSGKFKMKKDVEDNVEFKDMQDETIKREGVTAKEYQKAEDNVERLNREYQALLREEEDYQKDWDVSEDPSFELESVAYDRSMKEEELQEARKKYDSLMKKDGYMERKYNMPSNIEKNNLGKNNGLNSKINEDHISFIASTTNSSNDSYGYAFNEMLNDAERHGLKTKSIDIGNYNQNRASIEFTNGDKIDFYDLKNGKAFINNASTEDFEKLSSALNTYRVHKKDDISYDFNNRKWVNNNENVRINNRNGIDNSKYDKKYGKEKINQMYIKNSEGKVEKLDMNEVEKITDLGRIYEIEFKDGIGSIPKEKVVSVNGVETENDKFLQKAIALDEKDKGKISEEEYFNKLSEIDGLDPEKEKTRVRENLERLGVEVPDYLKSTKKSYDEYYKKEGLGKSSNYQKGDKVEFDNGYYEIIKGSIVREATDHEKRYNINSNLKGYIIRDENGFEHIVADTRIKNRGDSILEEYKKYMREHPNSVIDIDTFERNIKFYRNKK